MEANPVALALGAEATFVARTIDRDRHHLTEVLRARFLVDVESFTKIQGQPLFAGEIIDEIAARQ